MSPVHCTPEDAVLIHQDIKSKLSIGMHWGTFALTTENVNEPPCRLKKAVAEIGGNDEFITINIGETRVTKDS